MSSPRIPDRIRELERFGVGEFSAAEIAEKCAFVRALMDARPRMDHPRISVVVPAYREERCILATLRSLAEQAYADCEFLVVSNGEPAGNPTQRIAEACGFTVLHQDIPGIVQARQAGLLAARGEIVVSTDADTVHGADWLTGIAEITEDARVLCGGGGVRTLSENRGARFMQTFFMVTFRLKDAIGPGFVTGVPESNSFFRRAEALAAGGYDLTVRLGEGIMFFRRFHPPGVPYFYGDPRIVVYTSGRRIERHGVAQLALVATYNSLQQFFGKSGVGADSYPDVR
jgi:glycosyltransferase involved in cell wall biosynthesis